MKRKSVVLLSAALALIAAAPITYAANLNQLQQEEAQAEAQLAQEEQQYQQTERAINQTVAEMNQLNQELAAARRVIGSTAEQIQVTDQHIQTTQTLLNTTQQQLAQTERALTVTTADYRKTVMLVHVTNENLMHETTLLAGQLQLIEERGAVGYLDVILGARSFQDFVSRAELLGQIAAAAAQEVQTIQTEEHAYRLAENNLKRETAFLSEARSAINQHQHLLQAEESLLTREKEHAVLLQDEAVQEASTVSSGLAEHQQLIRQLNEQKNALAAGMANLRLRIRSLVEQIQQVLNQFHTGNLSRQGLYNALLPLVTPIANQWGVPPDLVMAVITEESGGNASAVSSMDAIGLMQVEPGTAADIASAVGLSPSTVLQELYNPEDNVELGTYYLHDMLTLFGGNVAWALAAYNAGPGAVQHYGGIPPYPQTQQYVANVMALYRLYQTY
ncbi:MAG: lytic transglycosylase domain-containing protein [Firmicutes bacterium]|nr:lytic transglycosylase domain-containing protein [Bacillota bacterium]